jgi:hypothetical protein
MVPHVAARKTHQRLLKFSFFTPKRLLQQYLPKADIPTTDPEGQNFLFSKCKKVGIASGLIGNYRSLGSEVA